MRNPIKVAIKSTVAADVPGQAAGSSRPGVLLLPPNVRRTFSEEFIPSALEEVGCSATPWTNLNTESLQGYMNIIYPELEYVVEKGDPLDMSVSQNPFRSLCTMYLPHAGQRSNHELPECNWDDRTDQRQNLFRNQVQDARTCRGIC